ncbi:MAG: hypothetical protein AAGH40_03720 [Verrucomicrobiota bacterium]
MKTDTAKCLRALSLLGVSTAFFLGNDQRGFFRPSGIENDIGSFEAGAIPEPSQAAVLIGLIALLAGVSRRVARL